MVTVERLIEVHGTELRRDPATYEASKYGITGRLLRALGRPSLDTHIAALTQKDLREIVRAIDVRWFLEGLLARRPEGCLACERPVDANCEQCAGLGAIAGPVMAEGELKAL